MAFFSAIGDRSARLTPLCPLVPGIDTEFDCPSIVPLICPRPLLTINGEIDKLNPLASTKLALAATASAYAKANAPDHFRSEIEPNTGHAVKPHYRREAIDWLVQWLKPAPPSTEPQPPVK